MRHCVGECGGVSVYHADALEILRWLPHQANLVFLDPPFNQGEPYDGMSDAVPEDQYVDRLGEWISAAKDRLVSTGSLWLNLPDRWAAEAVMIAKRIRLKLENWCIWHYRFAQCQRTRFLRSKTHALWFSKGNPYVNTEAAQVPSDRASLYNDPRIHESPNGGHRMDFDVWGFEPYWGRVQGNNVERGITPNQLPERYLARVVGVCSAPGALVLDPFCGSGTTATVCKALGRRCVTGDQSRRYAETALERVRRGAIHLEGKKDGTEAVQSGLVLGGRSDRVRREPQVSGAGDSGIVRSRNRV